MTKSFDPHAVRHYAGYVAFYACYVVRYFLAGDVYSAQRCFTLFEASLELATGYDLPPEPPRKVREIGEEIEPEESLSDEREAEEEEEPCP